MVASCSRRRLCRWVRVVVMVMLLHFARTANGVPSITACANVFKTFETVVRHGLFIEFEVEIAVVFMNMIEGL